LKFTQSVCFSVNRQSGVILSWRKTTVIQSSVIQLSAYPVLSSYPVQCYPVFGKNLKISLHRKHLITDSQQKHKYNCSQITNPDTSTNIVSDSNIPFIKFGHPPLLWNFKSGRAPLAFVEKLKLKLGLSLCVIIRCLKCNIASISCVLAESRFLVWPQCILNQLCSPFSQICFYLCSQHFLCRSKV